MGRAPFQVLVIPYRHSGRDFEYCAFHVIEAEGGFWQFVAGGGKGDETPLAAARRESLEEAGIPSGTTFLELQSKASHLLKWDSNKNALWELDQRLRGIKPAQMPKRGVK